VVLDGHQPLIDAIPAVHQNWADSSVLVAIAARWASARDLA
jgi:hypothetical protein